MPEITYRLIPDGRRWLIIAEQYNCSRWVRHPSGRVRYWTSEARAKIALAELQAAALSPAPKEAPDA